MLKLELFPVRLKQANTFVEKFHRHNKPVTGALFAVGAMKAGEVVGVAIAGRPVARHLDDGWTVEVTRCATDGTKNACSFLYAAVWKAARGMGYKKAITYTLPSEGGASLRGAGWTLIGECGGGPWNRPNQGRIREDSHPLQPKLRWEVEI